MCTNTEELGYFNSFSAICFDWTYSLVFRQFFLNSFLMYAVKLTKISSSFYITYILICYESLQKKNVSSHISSCIFVFLYNIYIVHASFITYQHFVLIQKSNSYYVQCSCFWSLKMRHKDPYYVKFSCIRGSSNIHTQKKS